MCVNVSWKTDKQVNPSRTLQHIVLIVYCVLLIVKHTSSVYPTLRWVTTSCAICSSSLSAGTFAVCVFLWCLYSSIYLSSVVFPDLYSFEDYHAASCVMSLVQVYPWRYRKSWHLHPDAGLSCKRTKCAKHFFISLLSVIFNVYNFVIWRI